MSTAHSRNTGVSIAQDKRQITGAPATHTTYRIDPAASRVEFTIGKRLFFVMHLMVTGRFTDVEGTIGFDEQEPANSRAKVTIGAASVDTRMGKRDAHLRKADFFDVQQHPTLTFVSRRIETIDRARDHYRVVGDLTVRGVTRRIALVGHGPHPGTRARSGGTSSLRSNTRSPGARRHAGLRAPTDRGENATPRPMRRA